MSQQNQTVTSKNSQPHTPWQLKLFQLGFKLGAAVAPEFTGCIAYKLWITPPRYKTPESEQCVRQSAKIETIRIKQQDIVTYRWGNRGPLVLLVHGWSGRGTQLGNFAEPLIAAGYQVMSFDAPAHGNSSGKQTNIYQIADIIFALHTLYGEFDSVITHSFGGPCLALAMQKGMRTNRVVNISPPAFTKGLVHKFSDALKFSPRIENELVQCIENKFGEDVWHKTSMINNLKHIDIPALVIHDADDTDVPLDEGERVAEAWKQVKLIITEKLGHRRILRDEGVIQSSINFIRNENPLEC